MQRDAGARHTLGFQSTQDTFVEVQRRRWRGRSAGVFGEDGLVAALVLGLLFWAVVLSAVLVLVALNVGRQGHVAVGLHELVRLVAEAKVKQRAINVRPTAQDCGFKPTVHAQHGAHGGLLADLHVRHDFVLGQHALNQEFELAPAGLLAKQARFHDLGVVEHQQVALAQQ